MLTTRKLLLAVLSLASCLACPSQGSELYTFEYTALNGPIESFSFSFTAPTSVTVGSSPAFAPFTVTDGTNSWTMTQDLVELNESIGNLGCFQFGTASAILSPEEFGLCSVFVPAPGVNQGGFAFDTTGLPTAPGIYTPTALGGLFVTAEGDDFINLSNGSIPGGTMTLNITDVSPEPSGLDLVVIGISVLCGLLVLRKSGSPLSREPSA